MISGTTVEHMVYCIHTVHPLTAWHADKGSKLSQRVMHRFNHTDCPSIWGQECGLFPWKYVLSTKKSFSGVSLLLS